MISILRWPEPPSLEQIRTDELRRIEGDVVPSREPTADDIKGKYRTMRPYLREMQFYKCCYCEKYGEDKYCEVEHYRPKAQARRAPGRAESGYWWLAWTWGNLLYICKNCNNEKGSWFPIHGSRLMPQQQPPGDERPQILDPANADMSPLAHIQFRLVKNGRDEQWRPFCRNGSPQGHQTISKLQLDRSALMDLYRSHAASMETDIDAVQRALDKGEREPIDQAWNRLTRHLEPHRPFIGLSYDIINHYIPQPRRTAWDLELSMPSMRAEPAQGLRNIIRRTCRDKSIDMAHEHEARITLLSVDECFGFIEHLDRDASWPDSPDSTQTEI